MNLTRQLQARLGDRALVLFDGECGFCGFWVRFVLKRDPAGRFVFVPLQARHVPELCAENGVAGSGQSVLLLDPSGLHSGSEAVLRIAKKLGGIWAVFALAGRFIPGKLRDRAYDEISRRRRDFSRLPVCRVPGSGDLRRFPDDITAL